MIRLICMMLAALCLCGCAGTAATSEPGPADGPYLIVLGIAQDGGVPQTGSFEARGWTDPAFKRRVSCLGLVDPATGRRWMFDATPDFPTQVRDLCLAAPLRPNASPMLDGIFLTHAHMGHYTGLMHLGLEAKGARGVVVHAMPRMRSFLETNGPWSQLVKYGNITLSSLQADQRVDLGGGLSVTPFLVPHRQEFSEVVGFRIDGPTKRALFIPDIDAWEQWDEAGTRFEDALATVDVAYVDGTFYGQGEIPGRNMRLFPHPLITHTMDRLAGLPPEQRSKVKFIHLNHTNPALWPDTDARREVRERGFEVAAEGAMTGL